MKPTHWMPLYIGDYLRDTLGLSRSEHGSYLLLIMAYWANGGELPNDDGILREIAKCPETEWMRTRGLLLRFFTVNGNHLSHKRINKELAAASETYAGKVSRAKAGAEARWDNASSNAQAMLKHSPSIPQAMLGDAQPQPQPQPPSQLHPSSKPIRGNISFDSVKIANRIIANADGWEYDNCKVRRANLKTKPLASLIEPALAIGASESRIIKAWQEAVRVAHGSKVDGMANDPLAYCIGVFKDQLKTITQ
jgi:uncharacterized protein YdaU (DUF1376 family)